MLDPKNPEELRRDADALTTIAENLRTHADALTSSQSTYQSLEQRISAIEEIVRKSQTAAELLTQVDTINNEIAGLKNELDNLKQVSSPSVESVLDRVRDQIENPPEVFDTSVGHGGAGKTVVCHFFNEEFLLPWWLKHHKNIFNHGIMIDYASTDRSCELIREICPTWEIRPSRNEFFHSVEIDKEVMDIERGLTGWRMALNVTEFLYGNTDHLHDNSGFMQYFIANYVFIDMADPAKGPVDLDHNIPLHQQRYWGYDEFANTGASIGGQMGRMCRSVHNYPIEYTGGRHFGSREKSFNDLFIFYYGHASDSAPGLQRKTQIRAKIGNSEPGATHHKSEHDYKNGFGEMRNRSRDLAAEIAPILEHNRRITGQEW